MPTKQTISILALSVLMLLPASIANAGKIQVQNGSTRVKIDRDGDIKIIRGRRRFYRPRVYRGSAIRVPSYRIFYPTVRNRSNCITKRRIRKRGFGNNRSYVRSTTTTCQ